MPDVTISSTDNLAANPTNTDKIAIIRDGDTVLTQRWEDVKDELQPDAVARQAAATAQAAIDALVANPPTSGIDQAAVDQSIATHRAIPNAHHAPPDITGLASEADLTTVRNAAASTQTEIDNHESATNPHNIPTHAAATGTGAITVDSNQNVGFVPSGVSEKTSFVDDDEVVIADSEDSDNPKRVKKSNLGLSAGSSLTPQQASLIADLATTGITVGYVPKVQSDGSLAYELDIAGAGGGLSEGQVDNRVAALVQDWAEQISGAVIPNLKVQQKVWTKTAKINIANDIPDAGSNVGDVYFEVVASIIKVYRVIHLTTTPYYSLIGSSAAASVTAGSLLPFLAAWAYLGNTDIIPPAKSGLNAVHPWALTGGVDVPYTALDTVLVAWAAVGNTQIIPDAKLPTARFLPSVTGSDDGKIGKVTGGAWALSDDLVGSGSANRVDVPRWRFVLGEETVDPLTYAGKVFLGFEFVDVYDRTTHAVVHSEDLGAFAFMAADRDRGLDDTISPANALDLKDLLAQASVTSVASLVSTLPAVNAMVWGQIYGLSNDGLTVESLNYRREFPTDTLRWGISLLGSSGLAIVRGFQREYGDNVPAGGSLYPDRNSILRLTEDQSIAHGTHYIEMRVTATDTALTSGTSVTLLYGDAFASSIVLIRDHAYSNPSIRRYLSSNYVGAKFITGERPEIKFRNGSDAGFAALGASDSAEKLTDRDELETAKYEVLTELYRAEGRVALLEDKNLPTVVELTQAAYDALTTKDPDTWYAVSG